MTTLELAEAIASAVICEHETETYETDANAYAVLRVLRENNSWFCRNPTGDEWHEEAEERYEMVQPELFK